MISAKSPNANQTIMFLFETICVAVIVFISVSLNYHQHHWNCFEFQYDFSHCFANSLLFLFLYLLLIFLEEEYNDSNTKSFNIDLKNLVKILYNTGMYLRDAIESRSKKQEECTRFVKDLFHYEPDMVSILSNITSPAKKEVRYWRRRLLFMSEILKKTL